MPPTNRLHPVTFRLTFVCRCGTEVHAPTTCVASSAGDRAMLADELQPRLSAAIDEHQRLCRRVLAQSAEPLL